MIDYAKISITLGDIADISAGFPLRGSLESLPKGDVYFVSAKDLNKEYEISWHGVAKVSLPTKRQPRVLEDGSILFFARGSNTHAFSVNNSPEKAVCGPQFFVITIADTTKILPEFITWQINQKPSQNYLKNHSYGSAMKNISRSTLEGVRIFLPNIEEQQTIVNFWKAAQKERKLMTQLIDNREKQLLAFAEKISNKNMETRNDFSN
jgi:restriction endonuclease S subunit